MMFHLKFHREPREIAVMALMVGKNGTRNMEPVKESDPDFPPTVMNPAYNRPVMPNEARTMRKVSMEDLALSLSSSDAMRDTPVMDHTGLPGLFDLTYTPVRDETTGRTIFDGMIGALPQLGLELKRQKATIGIYVIDSAEKLQPKIDRSRHNPASGGVFAASRALPKKSWKAARFYAQDRHTTCGGFCRRG